MELIDQHTKRIMEGCKERAREAGLRFHDETLEYIVTNRDLIELSPKNMIPSLYDYWVHDVEVLREKGRYDLYPNNPYETVINTRPAISFYNDNNPDWLNVMIFYHVLAHIDFFQNNMFFEHTWDQDFAGRALSDKSTIAMLRSDKGRWLDYVIEFSRSIDNLVGFYGEMSASSRCGELKTSTRLDFYFDVFLQTIRNASLTEYLKEVDHYNEVVRQCGDVAESVFFSHVAKKYPEFDALFAARKNYGNRCSRDLLQYVQENSSFLRRDENRWMESVMQIVRKTSLYFQPQIRTKILNEGWASYWHEKLFLKDDRIQGNEVGFARVNALVTSLPRVGINPYALGMRLFGHIEEMAEKGKISYDFQRIQNARRRDDFDTKTGSGLDYVLKVREEFNDFLFINTFVDQDFVDRHKLFVVGKRLNGLKGVWEYYVQSRSADKYKQMLLDSLYHPPFIEVVEKWTNESCIYLNHHFEGKQLVPEFIPNTMLGIEYLWGGTVKLETTELVEAAGRSRSNGYGYGLPPEDSGKEPSERRVLFTMKDRKVSKEVL
jgi:stage V sporulation protein R